MATTARKARKRAGIQFSKPAKVGTPIEERAIPFVQEKNGSVHPSRSAIKRLFGKDFFKKDAA